MTTEEPRTGESRTAESVLGRSIAFNMLGRISGLVMVFASSILLARLLGPTDRGLLAIMLSVSTVVLAIGAVGQPLAVTYYASRRDTKPDAVFGNTLVHAALLAGLVIPITVLLYHPIANAVSRGQGGQTWIVAAVLVPVTFLDWTASNQLLGMLRFGLYNGLKFVSQVAYTVAIVLLLSGLHMKVLGGLIATGVGSLVTIGGCVVPILGRRRPRIDRALLRQMLRYGSRVQVGVIFQMVNYRLDVIIMQFFRSLREIGLYVTAQTVAEYVITLAVAFQSSLLPLVSHYEGDERQRMVTVQSMRHYGLLGVFAALGNIVFGTVVILFAYGPGFRGALVPMLVLLPGVWFLGLGLVIQSDLGGRGRPGLSSKLAGAAAVVTVVLDLSLIPPLGVMGGAIASVCAYTCFGVTSMFALSRVSGIGVRELIVPTREDVLVYPRLVRRMYERFRGGRIAGSAMYASRWRERHPNIAFAAIALVSIALLSPLAVHLPWLAAALALAGATWVAWRSPAIPLALGGIPPLVDAIFGSDPLPKGGFTLLFAAWIALAVAFAVLRGEHRRIASQLLSLPVLGTFALFAFMVFRLGVTPDATYGFNKVELFLANDLIFFVAAIFVGADRRQLRLLLQILFAVTAVGAVVLLFNLATGSASQLITGRFALAAQEYPIDLGRASADGLLIGLFFLLSETSTRIRLRVGIFVPVLAIAMIAAGSRGPVLAFAVGLLALLALGATNPVVRRRFALVGVVFVLIAILVPLIVPSSSLGRALSTLVGSASGLSSNGRSDLWSIALLSFSKHLIFGLGTGGFAALHTGLDYPHNLVLEVAVELGLVGALMLLAVLSSMAYQLRSLWRETRGTDRLVTMILTALFLNAFTNACFSDPIEHNGEVWLWSGLAIGMGANYLRMQASVVIPRTLLPSGAG